MHFASQQKIIINELRFKRKSYVNNMDHNALSSFVYIRLDLCMSNQVLTEERKYDTTLHAK